MKVIFVSFEVSGIFKTGGLGDVAAALPKALKKLGVNVSILMPGYNEARKLKFLPNSKVPIVYIKKPEYFDITKKHTHAENFERFFYFCQKAVQYIEKEKPDIVHLNDWHTGMVAYLLKIKTLTCHSRESGNLYNKIKSDRFQVKSFGKTQDLPGMTKANRIPKIILTIHNAGYQGDFSLDHIDDFKNKKTKEDFLKLKFKGRVNFLKLGVDYSDFVTTVSANYANEMLNKGQGYGLEKNLRKKSRNFVGILNGIDYGIWDPEKDKFIEVNYTRRLLAGMQGVSLEAWQEGKKRNKTALQKKLRLPIDSNIPLIAFVGRLSWQKGIEKIIEGISELAKMDLQLVVLGKGDKFYEEKLKKVKEKYADPPVGGQVKFLSVRIKFDEKLAHLIYAGSDLLLIPSKYEPCGLTQMIAMKYGTIPVARKTGGLVDSIKDAETGFLFGDDTPKPMLRAIKKAIGVYYNWVDWLLVNKGHEGNEGNEGKEKNSKFFVWEKIVERIMKEDFSWEKSAEKYLKIYKNLKCKM